VLENGWMIFLMKILFGLFVMGISLYYFKGSSDIWLSYSAWEKIQNLLLLIIIGIISYFATLKIIGINLSDFTKKLSH
jgi:peptidoglycan biosynthesis protein MviN/MurJ (putative lipid II flippase)